mmetsp:Transcript_19267/g.27774  ORF Transcript_19267/g.27774 Transcript_19267/m.27774 type:complete len:124 (+) Transcript_19267:198-569(+)|eukprot:CAMPEP_0202449886 /NCGR_PEP_ID=MMETSP1360-20130828/8559_1 /ASSEMBLY_ACC=CAM_ASM_000848 /TAXON_ID=515479 /ORGANISM="Licmophora paradoxa, Strain CCMP2313" /LENGTH=123 /DNA_ID=CAMNT_0049067951 /DNA_START=106 /DNA_END=477 /DNA_ORIENTATION=+
MAKISLIVLVAIALFATLSDAFVVSPTTQRQSSALSIFGGGGGGGAGQTKLTYKGKSKSFKPGSPLSKAVSALGVKPKYSCKKGECATCQIRVAGRMVKPCVGKVPPPPTLKSLQEKGLEISG